MNGTELMETSGTNHSPFAIQPAMDVAEVVGRYQRFREFVSKCLVENVDFGIIPGTTKRTLYKPGAEKLSTFFGFVARLELIEKIEDWAGDNPRGIPLFYYHYRATVYRGDLALAESMGSANSWEAKYRQIFNLKECPQCHSRSVIFSKKSGRFLCLTDRGGCGKNFVGTHPHLVSQPDKIDNPDPFDKINTVNKMAQKRAMVGAVLIACNASDYFTTDDSPEETDQTPSEPGETSEDVGKRLAAGVVALTEIGISTQELVKRFGAVESWDAETVLGMGKLYRAEKGKMDATTATEVSTDQTPVEPSENAVVEAMSPEDLENFRIQVQSDLEEIGRTTKHAELKFKKNWEDFTEDEITQTLKWVNFVTTDGISPAEVFPERVD